MGRRHHDLGDDTRPLALTLHRCPCRLRRRDLLDQQTPPTSARMNSKTMIRLLGLGAFGLGLGTFAFQRLRWRDSTTDSPGALFTAASFNPAAPVARLLPITIIAIYQTALGGTVFQYLQLPSSAPWQDVVLTCQRLASCILRVPELSLPTELFSIRVLRGEVPLSSYRRTPGSATALWSKTLGRSLGDLNTARPSCKSPFCTQDEARLSRGSVPCFAAT